MIKMNNGTEFTSKALDAWPYSQGVDLIRPGKALKSSVNVSSVTLSGRMS